MTIEARNIAATGLPDTRLAPAVYFAGPVDYIEHRATAAEHLRDNWRHRFFGDLPIDLRCPICLNRQVEGKPTPNSLEIMETNRRAMVYSRYFVGHFPVDQRTFGTPIEAWEWCRAIDGRAVLVHPAKQGVFVDYLELSHGLVVVGNFLEARQWLIREARL